MCPALFGLSADCSAFPLALYLICSSVSVLQGGRWGGDSESLAGGEGPPFEEVAGTVCGSGDAEAALFMALVKECNPMYVLRKLFK